MKNKTEENLEDFNLGWVSGADVETLQVRLKHPLRDMRQGGKKRFKMQLHQWF